MLDPETARAALLAGAEYIVSPIVNLEVIRLCRRYDKAVMPGAFTPTEVVTAWEAGADIVKIFPADVGGQPISCTPGPLPQVRLMPTGEWISPRPKPFSKRAPLPRRRRCWSSQKPSPQAILPASASWPASSRPSWRFRRTVIRRALPLALIALIALPIFSSLIQPDFPAYSESSVESFQAEPQHGSINKA